MSSSVGQVELVRNEICIVQGIQGAGLGNVVSFSSGATGFIIGFDESNIEIVMLDSLVQVKKGDLVRVIADQMTVNIGTSLLGRVINPLGVPLDGMGNTEASSSGAYPIEVAAKPVYQRVVIDRPLQTGYLAIDSQIPIGLGQRELLLGEKKSGQNDLAIDVICNQARLKTGVICVYVVIDAETASAKRRVERLQQEGGLANTVVIIGRTAEAAALNYIAPMAGVTIAEWFAAQGKDVLIVFDNLTSHAKVYRQISLLLERPASREAYPGDVFYLHSRLLERCGAFSAEAGNGTITALPIVETQTEDVTDFITTNLMSITDGHVLFRKALANKGNQPPIDNGFSVSRVGGKAQLPLVRALSEKFKSVIIHYEEVENSMSFGSDIGSESTAAYELGLRAQMVLQQGHDDYYSTVEQCVLMYLVISEKARIWNETQIAEVRQQLVQFIRKQPYNDILNQSVLEMAYDHAEVVLSECMKDFVADPATTRPAEQATRLIAEIESIDGILSGDQEILSS